MSIERYAIELPEVPCQGGFGGFLPTGTSTWTYASLQADRVKDWAGFVNAYEANPDDFYNSWHYLNWHPAFWKFYGRTDASHAERFHEVCLAEDRGVENRIEVAVAKVNPATGSIDEDNPALNTKTEVWLETGKIRWPANNFNEYDIYFHDYELDCGGDTYEQAIIAMARNVHDNYGNDRMVCDDHRSTPRKLEGP
jgi:hypothetical protein